MQQGGQFFGNFGPCEHFTCLFGTQIHYLGDVFAVQRIVQHFVGIAQAAAGFAHCFDAVHEGHVGDNHPFAAAGGAAAFAVEGEQFRLHLVFLCKTFAYVIRNAQIGGGGGTQADAYVFLADADYFRRRGVGFAETFHERAFSRTGHACDAAQHAQRQLHIYLFQVVQRCLFQRKKVFGLAHRFLEWDGLPQQGACQAFAPQHLLIASFKYNVASRSTGTWPQFHHMVCNFNHFLVVFHQKDSVAMLFQLPYRLLQQADVMVVQTGGRLVKDVHHVTKGGVDVFGDFAALRLSSGKGADGAVQCQVA